MFLAAFLSSYAKASAFICVPPPPGLVSWWRAELNADDWTGPNPGRLLGGASFGAGNVRQAFSFDGLNDYILVPHNRALDARGPSDFYAIAPAANSFTWEGWIQAVNPVGTNTIFSKWDCGGGCYAGHSFVMAMFLVDGKLRGWIRDSDTDEAGQVLNGSRMLADSQFHHVALVRDIAAGQLLLYVDGTLESNAALSADADGPLYDPSADDPLTLGAEMAPLSDGPRYFFQGYIDELAYFQRALTPAELDAIYQAGSGGKCPPAKVRLTTLGRGRISPSRDLSTLFSDDGLLLTAIPAPYHSFLAWSDGNTDNPRAVVLEPSNHFRAIFTNTVALEEQVFQLWDRAYGGVSSDQCASAAGSQHSGFYLGGTSASPPGGNKTSPHYGGGDDWLVLIDDQGNQTLDESYGGSGAETAAVVRPVTQDGWVLGGASATGGGGNKNEPGFGQEDFWVRIRIYPGQRFGDNTQGGTGSDVLRSLEETSDEGFILAGSSDSAAVPNVVNVKGAPNLGGLDFWVVRTGLFPSEKMWERALGGTGTDFATSIKQVRDGGFVVAGASDSPDVSEGKSAPNLGGLDFWVVRLDPMGNTLWDRSYGSGNSDVATAVLQTADGGLAVGGTTEPTLGNQEFLVVRTDANGNELWRTTVGSPGSDNLTCLVERPDGSFLAGGPTQGATGAGKTAPVHGEQDFWLVCISHNGYKLWDKSFGGSSNDVLNAIVLSGDGALLAGTSNSGPDGTKTSPGFGGDDYWVIRTVMVEAPPGTPAILVNGNYSPSNAFDVVGQARVEMHTTFSGGSIFYTLDGSAPGLSSIPYTAPFSLIQSATVRAIAFSADQTQSAEALAVTVTVRPCLPPPVGLVSWWTGDDTGDDLAGANDGTLVNGAAYAPGKSGRAFSFDGVNDYVQVGAQQSLEVDNVFSVQAWIHPTGPGTPIIGGIIVNKEGEFELARFADGTIQYSVAASDPTWHFIDTTYLAPLDQWTHLVWVYDQGLILLYGNGVLVYTYSGTGPVADYHTGQHDFRIGGRQNEAQFFQGQIDEVAFYHRALSAAEVAALYGAGAASMCKPAPLLLGVEGGGSVTRVPDKPRYAYGESVQLEALSHPYFAFVQWSDGVLSPTRFIQAGSVVSLTALFASTVPLEELAFKSWDRSYGGDGWDVVWNVHPLEDGGFLVGGESWSGPSGTKTASNLGMNDIWVNRIDSTGQVIWDQTFGGTGSDFSGAITAITPNRFIMAGPSDSEPDPNRTSPHYGNLDAWRVEFDGNGLKLAETSYGGTGRDIAGLFPLPNGAFYLAGQSSSPPSGTKQSLGFGEGDFWLVQLAADGTVVWDVSAGGTGSDFYAGAVVQPDGGAVIAGFSLSEISGNKTAPRFGGADAWVVRFGPDGANLWQHSYGGESNDWIYNVIGTADGGLLLVGETFSGVSGTKTSSNYGSNDAWVLRLDANGNQLWDRTFGGSAYDYASKAVQMPDGGFLITAASDSPVSGNKSTPPIANIDVWLLRLDAQGNKLWELVLGGDGEEFSGETALLADGFVSGNVSGSAPSGNKSSANQGEYDYWVSRFFTRTAPVGMPAVLVNGQFHPDNTAHLRDVAQIELQTTLPGGRIHYTLDGSTPSTASPLYAGPFVLGQAATIRALAVTTVGVVSIEAPPVLVTLELFVPVITVQPAGQILLVGSTEELSVVATGAPTPSYQWRKNGVDLPGANQPTLRLSNVQEASAGVYTVVVSNALGRVTSQPATLTVYAPPTMTHQPADATVTAGSTAIFTVAAAGTPVLTYQWFREEDPLLGQTAATLTLHNAQPALNGNYSCRVENTYGYVQSAPAALKVIVPVAIESQPPQFTQTALGLPVSLCVTASGTEPIRYQWRKNGVNIPNQTNECLSIPSAQPFDSGVYTVVVENKAGAVTSQPFLLNIVLPLLAAGDNFEDRVPLNSNEFTGSNAGATKQAGEPDHAGQAGGRSVWYTRQPARDGIVTLRTSGSQFDTLLAVYVGASFAELKLVASDEDSAGYFASAVRFAVSSNLVYHVAVDGFDGASGDFVVTWALEPTVDVLPIITVQPHSQTVALDTAAFFEVEVDDPLVTYQWYLNDKLIEGAVDASYSVDQVQPEDLGTYIVRVVNSAGRSALSEPVVLEIGPDPAIQSLDKIPNPNTQGVIDPLTGPPPKGQDTPGSLTQPGASILVSAGTTDSQIFNNAGSTSQSGEPNHCGRLGGSTRWLILRTSDSGQDFIVDTHGSDVNTILAVYTRANVLVPLTEVDCAQGPGADSQVQFHAAANTDYWIALDGVNGAQGILHLNWRLGALPGAIASAATDRTTPLGGHLFWSVIVSGGFPSPVFQWRRNGEDIPGAAQASLSLFNILADQAGTYSVLVSNLMGMTEHTVASLTVDDTLQTLELDPFDFGADGWRRGNATATLPPMWLNTGGLPGGYIFDTDAAAGTSWFWSAPPTWLGNQSLAFGGALQFDLLVNRGGGTPLNGPDVMLLGAGRILVFDAPGAPVEGWSSMRVTLNEVSGWRVNDVNGPMATRDNLIQTLANTEAWLIRGDYTTGSGSSGLDNVSLVGPTETEVVMLTATLVQPSQVQLSWPESASGFQLESALSLDGTPEWHPISVVPISGNGFKQVTVDRGTAPLFFRLAKP